MGTILLILWAPCAVEVPREWRNEGLSPGPTSYRINSAMAMAAYLEVGSEHVHV